MDAFSVVVVLPRVRGCGSFGVAGRWSGVVGPIGGHGPAETLDFAVGPWAMGFDKPLLRAGLCRGRPESGRLPAEGVVGNKAPIFLVPFALKNAATPRGNAAAAVPFSPARIPA